MDPNDEEKEAITKLEWSKWLVKLAGRYKKTFQDEAKKFPVREECNR